MTKSQDLDRLIGAELGVVPPAHAAAMGADLAGRFSTAAAVLFYGSVLRTGDLDGVMDFYVLTRETRPGLRGLATRLLWPDVSYHEFEADGRVYRAKVATMTLAQFRRAVTGVGVDTTIWTRFVQPCALVWSADAAVAAQVREAVAAAAITAARFAAVVGPERGAPQAYWTALFRQTYAAEFRVEARGREAQIIGVDPGRYDAVLPAAWEAGEVPFEQVGGELQPTLPAAEHARLLRAWRLRRSLGKPLNLARLVKAAFTFEGAARYAAWKIERHTGLPVPLTPWRERHVILASPGVFWRLWKARRKA
ncbi:hypothetical protein [Phenylobacterium sp. Root700]|uniref:hypothetical protein n=1 Tax=Phenylobacterium sp. Root700 TaxID=1736591 RepID=UPI000701CEEF|nr:hypothetical protein [Phenylobacterium sp. Root700]KRB49424.1 hypothetical protein ASE02_16515 [Phenylobacterium sp. Root700]